MPDYAPQAFDPEVTHDTVHSQVLKFAVPVMTLPIEQRSTMMADDANIVHP
jgi:hypothetical protein